MLRKPEQPKICFGSGCPRDTSRKGMNAFMRAYTLDDYPNIGPAYYNNLESFKTVNTKV